MTNIARGASATWTVTVSSGASADQWDIYQGAIVASSPTPAGWAVTIVPIGDGSSVSVTISVPSDAELGSYTLTSYNTDYEAYPGCPPGSGWFADFEVVEPTSGSSIPSSSRLSSLSSTSSSGSSSSSLVGASSSSSSSSRSPSLSSSSSSSGTSGSSSGSASSVSSSLASSSGSSASGGSSSSSGSATSGSGSGGWASSSASRSSSRSSCGCGRGCVGSWRPDKTLLGSRSSG